MYVYVHVHAVYVHVYIHYTCILSTIFHDDLMMVNKKKMLQIFIIGTL